MESPTVREAKPWGENHTPISPTRYKTDLLFLELGLLGFFFFFGQILLNNNKKYQPKYFLNQNVLVPHHPLHLKHLKGNVSKVQRARAERSRW